MIKGQPSNEWSNVKNILIPPKKQKKTPSPLDLTGNKKNYVLQEKTQKIKTNFS